MSLSVLMVNSNVVMGSALTKNFSAMSEMTALTVLMKMLALLTKIQTGHLIVI